MPKVYMILELADDNSGDFQLEPHLIGDREVIFSIEKEATIFTTENKIEGLEVKELELFETAQEAYDTETNIVRTRALAKLTTEEKLALGF